MLARDLQRGSIVGAEHRQLHQPANARAHGGVDDVALLLRLSAALAREQEHAVDSGQRGLEGLGAIEVADDVLDGVAEPGARGLWIAYERPRPLAGGGEPPEHLAADRAGRSGHEDHADQPLVLRVMTQNGDGHAGARSLGRHPSVTPVLGLSRARRR